MNIRKNKQPPILFEIDGLGCPNTAPFCLSMGKSITQICKPVGFGILQPVDIKILPTRILDCLHEMECRATINSRYGPINCAALIPAPTTPCPHSSFQISLYVLIVLVVDIVFDFKTTNDLSL